MSSILGKAGATRIYNTNGTGRDTYISFNMGGNTVGNFPARASGTGTMSATKEGWSP